MKMFSGDLLVSILCKWCRAAGRI